MFYAREGSGQLRIVKASFVSGVACIKKRNDVVNVT